MSGRFGHFVPKGDRIKHFAKNQLRRNEYAYGFGGVTFWLDADYGLNTQTNLGAVSYWRDKIRGILFEQATAGNQPRLIVSDADFNNLPSVEFQSTGRNLQAIQANAITKDFTLVAIYKMNTITTQNNLLCENFSQGTANRVSLGGTSTGYTGFGVYSGTGSAPSASLASSVEDTAPHIAILTSSEIVIDGVQVATGSCELTSNLNTLGGGSNQGINGKLPELIIYSQKLTSTQCIQLSDNLNSKYAIY